MIDLIEEVRRILAAFDKAGVQYALCGGLALAVYSVPRATVDIDLLVPEEAEGQAREAVRKLGYTLSAEPMVFADGAIQVRRISKLDHPQSDEVLILDLILATPELEDVWESRQKLQWEFGNLWVVDRAGLIKMKKLRGSDQDREDIKRLLEEKSDVD